MGKLLQRMSIESAFCGVTTPFKVHNYKAKDMQAFVAIETMKV